MGATSSSGRSGARHTKADCRRPAGPEGKDCEEVRQRRRVDSWSDSTGQFMRFLIVGGTGTVLNMIVFTVCTDAIGLYYMLASVIAFMCAVTSNYYWNRRWTFKWSGRRGVATQYVQFVTVALLALGVNAAILRLAVESAGLNPKIGQLAGIAAGTLSNFAGYKLWVFAPHGSRDGSTGSTNTADHDQEGSGRC